MAELSTETQPTTAFVTGHTNANNSIQCSELGAPYRTITLLICLLGLVGNGIVIWFLGFRMKRNPFTVYVLNLAVADAGFLLSSGSFLVVYMIGDTFCNNPKFIYILNLFSVLCIWAYSTGLYLLTAISTERCVSILYPIWHRCHRPRHLSAIVSALFWALSCLLCCSIGIVCQVLTIGSCTASLLNIFVLNVLIFTPIMVLSSLTLFIKVRQSSQRRPPGKLYAVILLTVLFFLLLTLPQSLPFFLIYLDVSMSTGMFHVLACASSTINPFIYFLVGSYRKRRFRGSFRLALQRVFEDQTDCREARDTSPGTDPVELVV